MSGLTRCFFRAILLGSVTVCAGCGGTPVVFIGACPVTSAPAASAVSRIGDDPTCPVWGCGANSPDAGDGVVFDELDSSGQMEDTHGIRIEKATLHGMPVKLHVERHSLSAIATDGSGHTYTGGDLKDMLFTLSTRRDTRELRHELKIEDVSLQSLPFWAGLREFVPAYRISARRVPPEGQEVKFEPICKIAVSEQDPVWRNVDYYAIAFAGDRYNAELKTVEDAEPGTTWFNLACAGTATAKMHLMRHTNAGAWTEATWTRGRPLVDEHAPYATTPEQRQSMLKMFTADYCGTGHVFTVNGQPLRYRDAGHWYPNTSTIAPLDPRGADARHPFVGTIEAAWDQNGALCLDTPRRFSIDDVRRDCEAVHRTLPPPCGGSVGVLHWDDPVGFVDPAHPVFHAHVISANPPCAASPRAVGAP
jgi:hypothetical protein